MAKTKISEFSTTPGNNTDINGINIAEGCAPSGINNAIRELMSDLKEWQSGAMDVYVIPQGTAAAPGIQLYGDLDTGLYGFAANQLGVAVGGASAGYFSSAGWVGNVVATTVDLTNIEVTNIKAKDGTAAITIADSTGVVSVSTQLAVDNLNLSGNTLSSSDTNGNIILAPNGTGDVYIDADTIRVGDSNTNVTITSNGTADLILNTNSGTNSGSITIEDGVNGNIIIAPNGTGQVQITNAALDLTTIEVTNIKAKDGTAAASIADSTGVMTIASSVLTTTDINGGTIDGAVIGGSSAAAGTFTTITGTQVNSDNLRLDGNTLSSTDANGNIIIAPDGIGQVHISNTVAVGLYQEIASNSRTPGVTSLQVGQGASGEAYVVNRANNYLVLGANGGERARISANGAFRIKGAGTAGTSDAVVINQSAPTDSFVINASGQVGIGTSPTSSTLTVSAAGASQTLISTTGTNAASSGFANTGGTVSVGINGSAATPAYAARISHSGTYPISFYTDSVERARINSDGILSGWSGTNSAPTFSYTNDPNTGMYFPAADAVGFAAGGTEIVRITSTGLQVTDIKAKDGTAALSIADSTGAVTVATALTANGGAVFNENGADVDFRVEGDTDANLIFADASTDRVGIGTNTPTNLLTVSGTGSTPVAFVRTSSTVNAATYLAFQAYNASSAAVTYASLGSIITTNTAGAQSGALAFNTASAAAVTERMRLDKDGNLGVGETNPTYKLEVNGGTSDAMSLFNSTNANGAHLRFAASGTVKSYIGGAPGFLGSGTADDLGIRAVGSILFATAGSGVDMTLNTSGNLGIGTNNPAYRLDVSGQARALEGGTGSGDGGLISATAAQNGNAGVLFQTNSASRWNLTTQGTNGANLRLYNYALASTVATFDSSGNLGLGVTPSAWRTSEYKAVQVGNGASFYGRVTAGDEDKAGFSANAFFDQTDNRWEYIATDSASRYDQIGGGHYWFTAASGTAGNAITFTQAMTLDASGNLGIGQTNPSTWLVNGLGIGSGANDWGATIYTGTASTGYLCFADGATGLDRYRGYISYAHATNAMIFATDAAERMRIDASGRLFVGNTTAPGSGEIKQVLSRAGNTFLEFQNSTTNTGCTIGTINENFIIFTNTGALGSETYTERARITSGGYFKASNAGTYFNSTGTYHELRQTANAQVVTVSATNASFTSESIFSTATKTAGTDWMHFYGTSDGNTVANIKIFGNGNVQNANNSYAGISDQKLKQDIVDAGSQWDDIKNLQVRKYRFKASPNAPLQIGLVAQEAETVSPGLVEETVDRDSEGNDLGTTTKAVKYSVLYMKAIKALQEAMARIEKLEAEMAALKGV